MFNKFSFLVGGQLFDSFLILLSPLIRESRTVIDAEIEEARKTMSQVMSQFRVL